jgi:hypothetical protein
MILFPPLSPAAALGLPRLTPPATKLGPSQSLCLTWVLDLLRNVTLLE